MRRRFLQVVLMPEDGGEIRNFRIPVPLLRGMAIGAATVVLLLAASLFVHLKTLRDVRSVGSMRAENQALLRQLDEFRSIADDLEARIEWAGEAEREARLLAGLDPLDAETRKLGIGGPELQVEPSAVIPDGELRSSLREERLRLDSLRRQVAFQRQSYQTVLVSLGQRKEQLARTPTISPIRNGYTLTSGFGLRLDPFTGRRAQHNGLDFRAIPGTAVLATADGKVSFVGHDGDFGLSVHMNHDDGIETVYCHLKSASVRTGDQMRRGGEIGGVGSTGRSTGTHLHYEIRRDGNPVDPRRYILTPSVIVE